MLSFRMETKKLIEDAEKYLMHTYSRFPSFCAKGAACGSGEPAARSIWTLSAALQSMFSAIVLRKWLLHSETGAAAHPCIESVPYRPQIKLAKLLCANSFADKVFFCNSGAEANEAAISSHEYASDHRGADCYEIITTLNSFHGRTLGSLTATARKSFIRDFIRWCRFRYVAYNNIDALRAAVTPKPCAILLEPIQGEGGVVVPGALPEAGSTAL